MTGAQNHGVGPVILLRRVQMEKLNDSWVLRHPKSGQWVGGSPGRLKMGLVGAAEGTSQIRTSDH